MSLASTSNNRAVGYIRVSTEEQALEGLSLATQEQRVRAYCAYKGLELVELVVDAGVSASKPLGDRPGGAAVLTHLRRRKEPVRHVVALKLDRLFGETTDALGVVQQWAKAGAALHLIDLGGDSVDVCTGIGRFFLTMLAGVAELERTHISERTTAVLHDKRDRGQRTSRWAPYGYYHSAEGDRVIPEPGEQRVVALVHELRAGGMTFRGIVEELERRRITPRGEKWHLATVQLILRRPPEAGAL